MGLGWSLGRSGAGTGPWFRVPKRAEFFFSGFRVWGLGFRVPKRAEFRVQGVHLEFGVWGFHFGVWGLGHFKFWFRIRGWVWGLEFKARD